MVVGRACELQHDTDCTHHGTQFYIAQAILQRTTLSTTVHNTRPHQWLIERGLFQGLSSRSVPARHSLRLLQPDDQHNCRVCEHRGVGDPWTYCGLWRRAQSGPHRLHEHHSHHVCATRDLRSEHRCKCQRAVQPCVYIIIASTSFASAR
jgi:hypothetical protein